MSSDPEKRLQGEARQEHEQFTPEPSVEPEQSKTVQAASQSNDGSKSLATTAGPSTQPSADVNIGVESAGQSNSVEVEPKKNEYESPATDDVSQTAPSTSVSTDGSRRETASSHWV